MDGELENYGSAHNHKISEDVNDGVNNIEPLQESSDYVINAKSGQDLYDILENQDSV
jgi:hypothetical protein